MLIVRYFLSFFMVIFDVIAKVGMVESKVGFDLVFESRVESSPNFFKTKNSSDIEKSGSEHSTW